MLIDLALDQLEMAAFFSYDPNNGSGDFVPDAVPAILGTGADYTFKNTGWANDPYIRNFTWAIDVWPFPQNGVVGNATVGSSHYVIYNTTHAPSLPWEYDAMPYNCSSHHLAQMTDASQAAGVNGTPTHTPTQSTSANAQRSTTSTLIQPTSTNTQSSTAAHVALSLEAQLSIGIGSSIAVVMFFTFAILALRYFRQKEASRIAESKLVELDVGTTRAALSISANASLRSTPVSAILELHPDTILEMHPDTVIEMAGTDRQLLDEGLPQYECLFGPAGFYDEKRYTPQH